MVRFSTSSRVISGFCDVVSSHAEGWDVAASRCRGWDGVCVPVPALDVAREDMV